MTGTLHILRCKSCGGMRDTTHYQCSECLHECECGRRKVRASDHGCPSCRAIDADRYNADRRGELGQSIYRLLYHHRPEWLGGDEVRAMVDNDQSSNALGRLVEAGKVESRRVKGGGVYYRWRQ